MGKLEVTSLLTAFSASLCCITPVLALISGGSGFASSLSWLNPFRPYLIAISIAVLLFAWYRQLKPAKADCCETEKQSFPKSKTFLAIVTVVSVVLMTFPMYPRLFGKDENKISIVPAATPISEVKLQITGMDCEACEHHVNGELAKLNGVLQYQTSSALGTSVIKFDTSKIAVNAIITAVNATGYKVIHQSLKN
ncbi:mercuric transport protein MerTP [Mucilaginibacter rubeus]|uniref:Mercuric transport protein MerT n=2 Tax=Sphingobacteriaceae TaxID=84566 RepID=A0AAE6JPA9_9SPHI|nr:mercuric transport protein MerTP [Mucilaginibacter rubeus]QEM20742.1 mercuric transport protein MerTP [Mucilaginibacter gossypii]QTE47015.1 mercuric transport protein MerTP [Mucilaginibacter rubeus]QTE53616.1 mercuric transport protein MerTP [Mucilaginibacter rubeus]QTE60116.1 mercuric transport protein MerTP [Mucilaginibacter rubeus]